MSDPQTTGRATQLEADGDPDDVVGHRTLRNGRHEPLTRAEAVVILADCDAKTTKRAADMPDERAAIDAMFEAWLRLKELGWGEAVYCPKDGSSFDVIEPGSTGVFRCHYSGKWPDGSWWIEDGGDTWPSLPVLFRLDPEAKEVRREKMAEAARQYAMEAAGEGAP